MRGTRIGPALRVRALSACVCALAAASPAPAAFEFTHHAIDKDLPGVEYGETALADVNGDGYLDFLTGAKDAERTL